MKKDINNKNIHKLVNKLHAITEQWEASYKLKEIDLIINKLNVEIKFLK